MARFSTNYGKTTTHLELDDQITFTGQIPYEQIPREYARADVFVHPGVWPEPFGRTVLEAMQAGLPVVCTDVGGPADVVREAELRCEPGDPDGLAAKIEFAYSNRAEIGDRNRKYVVNTYSPSTVTARTVELYESVMRTLRTGCSVIGEFRLATQLSTVSVRVHYRWRTSIRTRRFC